MEARRSSLSPVVPRSFSVLYPSHRETKKRHTIADRSLTDALALTTPSKKLDAELVDFGSPLTRKTKSPSFNDEDFKQLLKSPLGSSTKIKSMDSDLEELYRVRPQTSRTVRDSELFELDDDIIPVPSSDQPQEFQVQHFRKEDLVTFDYEEPTNEIKAEDLGEKLDLIERLSHPRWQVRRKVYSEIADSFRAGYFMMKVETSMNVFDYFEHKLKDIVSDTNITSQLEGLQTILTYTKCTPQIKQSVYFLGDELIPKCALTKQKSGEIVNQILTNMLERDSDLLLFHQIIKRFTAKNHKEACFSISCIKNALSIFPSTINIGKSIYSSTKKALSHSISEVRNEATNLLKEFFSYVYDSEEVFISKLDLKPQQIKEIKESLSIISKKEIKWVLFEDLKKPDENMLIYETENFENLKIDLISLAPQGFFETPYSNDIKSKKEIIGRFIQEIEKPVVFEIKDYSTVVNTLLHLVENTNSLVYIESMKAIEVLVLKLPKSFAYKGRHYVQFLVDKYKEKKKNVTLQINNILHLFRVHEVLPSLTIVDLLVEIAVNHKVPTVRELSLLWICEELNTHQKKNVDLLSGEYSDTAPWYSGNLENMIETIGKKVSLISKNDIVSTVRDAGIRLLGIFKSLSTGTSTSKYIDNLISKLPKRRIIEIDEKTRKSSKSRSPSPLPKLEYHKLDQDIIRNSSRSRSPSPSPIQKPDYQKLELDLAEISRSNTHEEPPKSFRKDLEGILGMIKEGDSHFKLEGLARFIRLVEDWLAASEGIKNKPIHLGSWRRGMGRISQEGSLMIALFENFEELKTFAFEISQCTKYKNYAQNPSKFEELQHITLEALTSLRIVISDKDAENLFKILLFEIPIKHSTSNFVKNFNEKTYQLFSDWLAHMPIAATIALIAQLLSENGEYNLNLVFIHAMQWLLTVELTSANFEINAIAPVLPVLVKGLAGIPIINSHPLSDSTLQLMIATSESFLTFLLEKFQENALSRFVDSQLVNHGKLLNIYLNWFETNHQKSSINPSMLQIISNSPQNFNEMSFDGSMKKDEESVELTTKELENESRRLESSKKKLNFDLVVESPGSLWKKQVFEENQRYSETQKMLEEVNKEYLSQVAVNDQLMKQLEEQKEINRKLANKVVNTDHRHIQALNVLPNKEPEAREPLKQVTTPTPYDIKITKLENTQKNIFSSPAKPDISRPYKPAVEIFKPPETSLLPLHNKIEGIFNFQHLLLYCTDPIAELLSPLLDTYTSLTASGDKQSLLKSLYTALTQEDILAAMNIHVYKAVLEAVLRFCSIEKMMSEKTGTQSLLIDSLANSQDMELTNELQKIAGVLLEAREPTVIILILFSIMHETIPRSFKEVLPHDRAIYMRLLLKCKTKLLMAIQANNQSIRVFDILVELNRLFDNHPPEELTTECPSVFEYEHMFKVLRNLSDILLAIQPNKVQAFLRLITRQKEKPKNIFVKYMTAALAKRHQMSV